jgi:hypothetical protein
MASRSNDDTLDGLSPLSALHVLVPPTDVSFDHPKSAALDAIAGLLNTGLDRQSLASCVALIEGGVQPEALAVRLPP